MMKKLLKPCLFVSIFALAGTALSADQKTTAAPEKMPCTTPDFSLKRLTGTVVQIRIPDVEGAVAGASSPVFEHSENFYIKGEPVALSNDELEASNEVGCFFTARLFDRNDAKYVGNATAYRFDAMDKKNNRIFYMMFNERGRGTNLDITCIGKMDTLADINNALGEIACLEIKPLN